MQLCREQEDDQLESAAVGWEHCLEDGVLAGLDLLAQHRDVDSERGRNRVGTEPLKHEARQVREEHTLAIVALVLLDARGRSLHLVDGQLVALGVFLAVAPFQTLHGVQANGVSDLHQNIGQLLPVRHCLDLLARERPPTKASHAENDV